VPVIAGAKVEIDGVVHPLLDLKLHGHVNNGALEFELVMTIPLPLNFDLH